MNTLPNNWQEETGCCSLDSAELAEEVWVRASPIVKSKFTSWSWWLSLFCCCCCCSSSVVMLLLVQLFSSTEAVSVFLGLKLEYWLLWKLLLYLKSSWLFKRLISASDWGGVFLKSNWVAFLVVAEVVVLMVAVVVFSFRGLCVCGSMPRLISFLLICVFQ